MPDSIKQIANAVAAPFRLGQIFIERREGAGFVLLHHDDESRDELETFRDAEDAIEISKYRRRGKLSSAQNRTEPATWLAARSRHGRSLETCPGLFLPGAAGGFRGVEDRASQNHSLARNLGPAIRNVSGCRKNFRCAD